MIVRITSKYGSIDSVHAKPHTGIDLGFAEGTPLRSISNGVARVVDYGSNNIGKGVLVDQADGTTAIYGHLSNVSVTNGQTVRAGDLIGNTGNTGHSTGPHLHFGLKHDGQFVDPTEHADTVMQLAGNIGWVDKIKMGFANYRPKSVGEWAYEKYGETVINGVKDGFINYATDLLIALPIIAVVSGGVYVLCSMVNKRFGAYGAGLTFLYGALALLVT